MPLTITRIPEPYRSGLVRIKTLPAEAVSALAAALDQTVVTTQEELAAVVERTAGINQADATSIISALRSLYIFRAMQESSVEETVTTLAQAMQATGGDLAIADNEKEEIVSRLTRLLSLGGLSRTSKIQQLKADHDHIFHDAKILTDLRPVFDQPENRPVGAIVIHTLKLVTHKGAEHKEMYVALDAEDLFALKKVVERAIEKMASLKAFLETSKLSDLS